MVEIREATVTDGQSILDVHIESIRGVSTTYYNSEQIDAWATQHGPNQYPFQDSVQYIAVAEIEESIIGFGGLDLEDGKVEALYVHPDATGEGVGSTLLSHLETVARQHDHPRLTLDSSLNAVPFYEQHSFERGESISREMAGLDFECIRMTKRIGN